MNLDEVPVPLRPILVVEDVLAAALAKVLEARPATDDVSATKLARLVNKMGDRGWSPEAQAQLVETLTADAVAGSIEFDRMLADDVLGFIDSSSPSDVFAVRECTITVPPVQFTIDKLLSRSGHEKLAFLARSTNRLGPVVLKRFRAPESATDDAVLGEITARSHPNIVHTDYMQNSAGEHFFTEAFMERVFDDDEVLYGHDEPANLLHDLLSAVAYLHGTLGRIHGDIKPDNVAASGGRYLLLDFGNSTPISETTGVPSGSFRTRAPELLGDAQTFNTPPGAADVWSVGATVFHLVLGRFPLLDRGESTPTDDDQRTSFKEVLRVRAADEYSARVTDPCADLPAALAPVVRQMLGRDPAKRPTAGALLARVEQDLAPYLRQRTLPATITPREELGVLERHVPLALRRGHTPRQWVRQCERRLTELGNLPGWTIADRARLEALTKSVAVALREAR